MSEYAVCFCLFLLQGCYSSLEDAIKSHLGVIIGIGVGIAMIQVNLFILFLSVTLCN